MPSTTWKPSPTAPRALKTNFSVSCLNRQKSLPLPHTQERIKYEYDMTTERDIRNQIAFAEKKGMDIGKAEGIAEGRTQERQRIVEELRKQGIPEEVIQQAVSPSKKG